MFRALSRTLEEAAPWLLDLGTWIFGALIAFAVLMLASLLTVGPVDTAVRTATAAFAVGLPPEVSAFILLRLVRDLQENKIQEIATRSFADVGLDIAGQLQAAGDPGRRRMAVLATANGLLAVSVASALVGIGATLWHMGWWISVTFLGVVAVSQFVVFRVIVRAPQQRRRNDPEALPPPGAPPT